MFVPYPLIFQPILKPRVWGGRRLTHLGKILPADASAIGESWEIADLPPEIEGGRSTIANGPLTGTMLHKALEDHGTAIMGRAVVTPRGGFPLLIKYLDARENLSLQVHPSADYAVNHPGSYTKSEAWVIVEAEPGSVIYKGLRPGLTRDELRRHIESGRIVDDLIKVPALAGDCHYLPSGTCHALGAGVLVAEVQTPSDTTFRLYDWGRTGRALHIEEALRCIDFSAGVDKLHNRDRVPIVTSEFVTEGLCEAECFTIERVSAVPGSDLPVVTGNAPVVWMIISGAGVVRTPEAAEGSESVAFATGTTMLMPATIAHSVARFHRKTAFLKVGLPSFIRDFLA